MFTGIVEEVGKIITFNSDTLEIECSKVLEGSQIGDSICVNGVCQTVVSMGQNSFTTRLSETTRTITTFSTLKKGDIVNLERALTLSSRVGGHLVLGHVEAIGTVSRIVTLKEFYNVYIKYPQSIDSYIVQKGSITVDGISLTVAEVHNNELMLAIIPHTFNNTNLKTLKPNSFVNIETDILSKYVEKFLSRDNNKEKTVITEEFLRENGF